MKNRSVLDQLPLQFPGIDQVAIMSQSQSSLDIRQNQRLGVLRYRRSGGRITDMADTNVAGHFFQSILPENFTDQSQVFMKLYISDLPACI